MYLYMIVRFNKFARKVFEKLTATVNLRSLLRFFFNWVPGGPTRSRSTKFLITRRAFFCRLIVPSECYKILT